jgi:hypothetical protein
MTFGNVGCASCGHDTGVRREQEVAVHQWTDRGYVSCKVMVPTIVCEQCGMRTWEDTAQTIIDDAMRRELENLK